MRWVKKIFIFSIISIMFLASNAHVFAAGQCGVDLYRDGVGNTWTTGCFLINVGGTTVPESGWNCGVGDQCFLVEKYVPSNIQIKWTALNNPSSPYNGKPALCVGGFKSEQELHNHRIDLGCTINCGGYLGQIYNGITGQSSQSVDLSNSPAGKNKDGTYFTCITGDLDGTARAVIEDYYRDKVLSCTVVGGGAALVSGLTGTSLLIIPVIVAGTELCFQSQIDFPVVESAVINKTTNSRVAVVTSEIKVDLQNQSQAAIDPGKIQGGTIIPTDICNFAGAKRSECTACVQADTPGIWTAVGCIPASPQDFVTKLLQLAIGIAGGIAFLMIIYGGFTMMLSSGNPEKLNSGKEIVTSAIAGLLLIIFSVVILRIIGVDVLGIPGLQ